MGFNYGKEKRCFDDEWKKLAKQYAEAGFDVEGINAMRDFDWELFKNRRTYENNVQTLSSEIIENYSDGSHSNLFNKFSSLSVSFNEENFSSRYGWIDAISDPNLSDKLAKLSADDKELLTLLVFDEYTQTEIAKMRGCSHQLISKKIKRIKIFLK